MEFADPRQLFYLWAIPVVVLFIWLGYKRRLKRLQVLAHISVWDYLLPKINFTRAWWKSVLFILGIIALVITFARPRWGFQWQEVKTKGVDVFIALDVSKSMWANDIKPNRLERAKREVFDLLELTKGDRLGVISFAGSAFIQCPLTTDMQAAKLFLSVMDDSYVLKGGTAIGSAIDLATESLLKYGENQEGGKAIIVITDGEDQGTEPLKAAERAKEAGIKVFTIGIGSPEGAPIPLPEGGFQKDTSGNVVISKLAESTLQQIANTTGGRYVRSVSGDMDLEQIYVEGIRKGIEATEREMQRKKLWNERFQWFALIAFILIFLDSLIGDLRPRKQMAKQALLLIAVFAAFEHNQASALDLKGAHKDFEEQRYDEASKKFLEAEVADPEVLEHSYNRAVSDYKNQDFARAAQGFERSKNSEDPKLKKDSLFNLGNTYTHMQKYDDAIKNYSELLNLDPKDMQARENLKYAQTMKEVQKQQQQQQSGEKGEKGEEGEKDENQQSQQGEKQDGQKADENGDKEMSEQDSQGSQDPSQQSQEQNQEQNQNQQQSGVGDEKTKQEEQSATNTGEQNPASEEDSEKKEETMATQESKENNQQESKQQQAQQPVQGYSKREAEKMLNSLTDQGAVMRFIPEKAQKHPDKPLKQDW